jgi:uncharacterized phiE125 gp8 family phage protein
MAAPSGVLITSGPAAEPVTADDARKWVRQDSDYDDDLLTRAVRSARQDLEARWERCFVTQTVEEVWDRFPPWGSPLVLTRAPVQSVTSITYLDPSGAELTWPSTQYRLDRHREPCRVSPNYSLYWPLVYLQPVGAVKATYVAGYGTADVVPDPIKEAILYLVGQRYISREPTQVSEPGIRAAVVQVPWTLEELDATWANPHPYVA